MNSKFTKKAQTSLSAALGFARSFGHTYVGSEHLLLGLADERDSAAAKLLGGRGASSDKLKAAVAAISGRGGSSDAGAADMTPCVKRIIEEAGAVAVQFGQSYIGTEHLLFSLIGEAESVGVRVLETCGVQISDLRSDVTAFLGGAGERPPSRIQRSEKQITVLSGFGRDLTAMAKLGKLDPVIGRDAETSRVIQILSRRQKNNPCLIGEPGVGKTAIVEGLAERISSGNVPDTLKNKQIVTVDIPSMIAGAKYRGEFEERMKNLMREASRRPEMILFVDEIHTIIGAGSAEGAVDAANIIKPALARGELRMIGATTIDEYRRHIEKDAALERRFQPVTVEEPSEEESIAILSGLREKFEAHHKLTIPNETVLSAVKLSKRYVPDRFLPDKAIDLIDETAARLRVAAATEPEELKELELGISAVEKEKEEAITSQDFERAAKLRDDAHALREKYDRERILWQSRSDKNALTVTPEDVADTVVQWTGIPLGNLSESENERLAGLEETLKREIVGQDEAIASVARAIRRGRIGLSDPDRPTGSFIFTGPTGVGKTALAEKLAETVFGSASALLRFDMSEYSESHGISKLIGSPPGYVGYSDGGLLTEKVRRRPYSVVLFDEIEKADPGVFDLLLQILDDGRLTDAQGRSCDFRNTIIILTSNLGGGVSRPLGFSGSEEKRAGGDELSRVFRPEFINRIDGIINFSRLSEESLLTITAKLLLSLSKRALNFGVALKFEPEVKEFIVSVSDCGKYGARPLGRAVSKYIGDAFSSAYLAGEIKNGDDVTVGARDGKIILKKSEDIR